MYTVHSFPIVAFVLNWLLTDVVLYEKHIIGLNVFGITYAAVNAYHTITSGIPLYPFLTWKDYKSPLICLILIIIVNLIYGTFVNLTRMMKPSLKGKKD